MNNEKTKLGAVNEKIAEAVTNAYSKIAKTVVGGYEKVEQTAVGGYSKLEDAFVDRYLKKDTETLEEAKERLKREHVELPLK